MKAMMLEKPGKLLMKDLEIPDCGHGEVLIKVKVCNICRTDLKCITMGQRDLIYPRVLGHEISGIVIEKGKNISNLKIGQRVHIHPGIPCGECDYCKRGLDNLCDHIEIMGFNFDGGFQEVIKIPEKAVIAGVINQIDNEELKDSEISFIEPIACCINIQNRIEMKPDSVLVIIGGGRLGILNLLVAKSKGVKKVILIESDPKRRNLGKEFGFDAVFSGKEPDLEKELSNATNGHGVDVVIPCCPEPEAFDLALEILRKQGILGYFSGLTNQDEIKLDINRIHYKELTVLGSYGCRIAHSREAKALLETGKVDVRSLISKYIKLEELTHGMECVKKGDHYSIIVVIE